LPGTATIGGTIIADNRFSDCGGTPTLSDQGYNLDSDGTCGFTASTDLASTNPQLDPSGLQSNGGPTQTIALQSTSPAIDLIPTANNMCPATDQRGGVRPDDGETACDIGAYESGASVTPADDDVALNAPANIEVLTMGQQPHAVNYSLPPTTDEGGDSTSPLVFCSPKPGTPFPVGTTTVNCLAADADDSNGPGQASFTVSVVDVTTVTNTQITLVHQFHLQPGLENSLVAHLNAAFDAAEADRPAPVCGALNGFTGEAEAQTGKGLTVAQAGELIPAVQRIQSTLGCEHTP
jgi:hypothetical protein